MGGIGGDHGGEEDGARGGSHQFFFKDDRGKAFALEVTEVVVEIDMAEGEEGEGGEGEGEGGDGAGVTEPGQFEAFAAGGQGVAAAAVEDILAAAEEEDREEGHHGDEADQEAAAGDEAHFADAGEVGEGHGEEGAGGGEGAGEDALAGIDHGFPEGELSGKSGAEFLFVAGDEVDAEVDGHADEHGGESDGEDIEATDDEGGIAEGIAEADEEAGDGFEGSAGFVVAIDEDDADEHQGDHGGQEGIPLGLGHLVDFEHGPAGDIGIDAGDFVAGFVEEGAESEDGLAGDLGGGGADGEEEDAAVIEGEIDLVLGFGAAAEEGIDAGGRGGAGAGEAVGGLGDDPFEGGEGADQGIVFAIGGGLGGAELAVDDLEQGLEVGGGGDTGEEGLDVVEGIAEGFEFGFVEKEEGFGTEHGQVAAEEDIGEEVGIGGGTGAEAFDELPIFLGRLAFDDSDDVIFGGELLAKFEEDTVVMELIADQVVAAGGELEVAGGEDDASDGEGDLGPDEPAGVMKDGVGEALKETDSEGGAGEIHRGVRRVRSGGERSDGRWCRYDGTIGRG